MATDVGSAKVKISADVKDFARDAEVKLNAALAAVKLKPIKVPVDTENVEVVARRTGRRVGKRVSEGADEEVRKNKGKFARALRWAFTPNRDLFNVLRAPFSAALSTPITAAVLTVAASAALIFISAFATTLATAGLGAVFLAAGTAALFGARKARQDAEKDLAKAEERVRKAQETAKSGSASAKRALADARMELAKAQEQVAKNQSFKELDSSLDKLKGTLKDVAQAAAKPLMKPVTDSLNALSRILKDLKPLFTQIFAALAPAIKPLTEGIGGFVKEFLRVLTADPKTLQNMEQTLEAFGKNLPGLGEALGQMFALFASNKNNVRNMGYFFAFLESSVLGAAYALYGLSRALDWIVAGWKLVFRVGGAVINWITGTAVPWIVGAARAIAGFFTNTLPSALSSAWSSITGFFSDVGMRISGAVSSIAGFFQKLPGRIGRALKALPGTIIGAFSAAIKGALYIAGYGLGRIVKAFLNFPKNAYNAIRSIISLTANVFNAVWNKARNIVTSGISSVIRFLRGLPGKANSAIRSIVSVVSGVFNSAKSSATSRATSLVNGAVNIIRNLPGRIRSALSRVKSAVTSAFSGASRWLVSAGRNLLEGIKNGIVGAIGGAVSAARSAAQSIVKGFKDALRIGSPSKVGEDEIGAWIPPGIAKGITKNMGVVSKAIRKTIPDITLAVPRTRTGANIPVDVAPGGFNGAGASQLSAVFHPGAIVIQGQGEDAGRKAAEEILKRLGEEGARR